MARSEPIASREAKLFRNNKSQAVRIPADFELPGTSVMIHRDGERLILEPIRRRNISKSLRASTRSDPMTSSRTSTIRCCRPRP
jgi:antitoxin VapB